MASIKMKPLFLALLSILLVISKSTQNPTITNYNGQLLRQAKAAEFMSYHSDSDTTCSNFYAQACANWQKSHPASFDKPKTSHLGQIHDLYVSKARDLLRDYEGAEVSHVFVSKFYASCANKTQTQQIGLKPILDHLDFRGGWPAIENSKWYEKEFDWLKTVADIRRDLGLNLFIGLELKPIAGHYANLKRIEIGAPQLALGSKERYLDDDFEDEREDYKNRITEKLRKHFPNMTELWCEEVAGQVLNVEISLAKGLTEVAATQPLQNDQTIAQLNEKYISFVDFGRYLQFVFGRPVFEPIHERPSDYFSNLLKVIEQTPKLTIANYTMWCVLDHLDFVPDKNQDDYEIWCTKQVIKHFPAHVGSLYATEYKTKANDNTGVLVRQIFGDIKKALETKFEQSDKFKWMSAETRLRAMEHFARMIFSVEDSTDLEKYLDNILYAIKSDQYYENLLQILQLETKRELQISPNDFAFQTDATARIPYYSAKHMEIVIPTEFLQTHFLFDPEYPNAINYGTIGVLLAQQLVRGILTNDTTNRWWDDTTELQFAERRNCFAKQLGNYEFHGKRVNDKDGVLKLMIYTSAVELAFDAYSAQKTADQALTNQFSYGNERLFFLSFAEMYCADYNVWSFNRFYELPERFLVKGALTNLVKFAEVFSCTSYTQMNVRNKCTIF